MRRECIHDSAGRFEGYRVLSRLSCHAPIKQEAVEISGRQRFSALARRLVLPAVTQGQSVGPPTTGIRLLDI